MNNKETNKGVWGVPNRPSTQSTNLNNINK